MDSSRMEQIENTDERGILFMNKPVLYMQTDKKYKYQNYSTIGEQTTIGKEGCGICAAAMVIASLKDSKVTPITTSKWSMKHGYKALRAGTYYGYFEPQLAEYGIKCKMLGWENTYGNLNAPQHKQVVEELKKGNWVIAVMGKGRWTTDGHYVLAYGIDNKYVYINDSYNTRPDCSKALIKDWQKEVKHYWVVETNVTPSIKYKVWTRVNKWLPWVNSDTDYAGVKGRPISIVKIQNIKNIGRVKYRVHFIENNKWSKWKIGGATGVRAGVSSKTIDAVQIELLDSNNYALEYRTSYVGKKDYSDWVNSTHDYTYSGTYRHAIDRLQIRVIKK